MTENIKQEAIDLIATLRGTALDLQNTWAFYPNECDLLPMQKSVKGLTKSIYQFFNSRIEPEFGHDDEDEEFLYYQFNEVQVMIDKEVEQVRLHFADFFLNVIEIYTPEYMELWGLKYTWGELE